MVQNGKSIFTVVDFRQLNKWIQRFKNFLNPVHEILASVRLCKWLSVIDLPIAYYTLHVSKQSRLLFRTNTIFGVYEALVLPMGVAPSSDIFQRKIVHLLSDVPPPPKVYIDDLLAAAKHIFAEHLAWLGLIFQKLAESGLQVNIVKFFLCQDINY